MKTERIKRRHIRFIPQCPKRVTIYITYNNGYSVVTGYFDGIVYDISLGELGIVVPPNTLEKGKTIDIKIENYGKINNCTIMRTAEDFVGIRFEMSKKNNNIVLDFIQDNLENLKTEG